MTDTIEQDLERLEYFVNAPPIDERSQALAWQALARIRAALTTLPTDPDDERMVDELMAKRAEGLAVRSVHPCRTCANCSERLPSRCVDCQEEHDDDLLRNAEPEDDEEE